MLDLLEVYEDDLERNYAILVEVLIAHREILPEHGLPSVKDCQATCLMKCSICIWMSDS
jgi:hypothetical protein